MATVNLTIDSSDLRYVGSTETTLIINQASISNFETQYETTWSKTLTLENVMLNEGYEWVDPLTQLQNIGNKKYLAKFTPNDTKNYKTELGEISVNVIKADAQIYSANKYNFVYNTNGYVLEGIDINQIIELANQGVVDAEYMLATCYDKGIGIEQNSEKAFFWFERAANQGDAGAQHALGLCYDIGKGVAQNYEKAFYWYKKSAALGNAKAQYNLASCYEEGQGTEQDLKRAFYWYRNAANQGIVSAWCVLGYFYANGIGVAQDIPSAIHWFTLAAEQGPPEAAKNLELLKK